MVFEATTGSKGGTKIVAPSMVGGGGAPVPAWPAGGGAVVDISKAPFELMGARGALPMDKYPHCWHDSSGDQPTILLSIG